MPQDDPKRQPVLDERGLAGAGRVVWAVCIATYLIVFIGGIQAGASDLGALGRAMGFTLGAAILGRIAIGLLSRATQPLDKGPTASQDGTVGSRVDLLSSPNTPAQDEAAAA
jgi:hypothetical protein